MSNNVRAMKRKAEKEKVEDNCIQPTLDQLLQSASKNNSQGALDILLAQPMPIVMSFKLSKIAKATREELEAYSTARKTLAERLSAKDEEGNVRMLDLEGNHVTEMKPGVSYKYDMSKENEAEFEKEQALLLKTQVTLPGHKIKVAEMASVQIAPGYLMMLDWLIAE